MIQLKKKHKLLSYPLTFVFGIIIFSFMLADMLIPDRDFSELENKKLQQRPSFSIQSMVSNTWTAEYNVYVREQFVGRDFWIYVQSFIERTLLQKQEIGGILIGDEGMLFSEVFQLTKEEEAQFKKNMDALTVFADKQSKNVTLMVVPISSMIYPENMPDHAPMYDQNGCMDYIYSVMEPYAETIDLRETLLENKENYIFYRTDHHWTTEGALLAYQKYCEAMGLEAVAWNEADRVCVDDFYGTSYSASRLWNAKPDTLVYYKNSSELSVYQVMGENQFELSYTDNMYDEEKLDTRDKYAFFLHGNNGYSTIRGKGNGSLLVIKDSYANCFVPFLTENYERIDVIDLRNYNYSLDSLIQTNQYNDILLLYGLQSMISDPYLINLIRPSVCD